MVLGFLAILIVFNTVSIFVFGYSNYRSALYFPSKTAILGKKASGPRVAKTVVTSLVRVGHSKDGIVKQWESELDSSSDILQCLKAVSGWGTKYYGVIL